MLDLFRQHIAYCAYHGYCELQWQTHLDVGWLLVKDEELYSDEYFDKYLHYQNNLMGKAITDFRCEFVSKYYKGGLVDIGIGSGHFIEERGYANTHGYDVSKYGIDWLNKRGLFIDPYHEQIDAITCWDSLEHIEDCWELISKVRKWVFISVPVVESFETIEQSPHYKPHEHWWYFTAAGIVRCFEEMGFELIDKTDEETELGRRDIMTYAFRRVC